jgi:hypothetical protein
VNTNKALRKDLDAIRFDALKMLVSVAASERCWSERGSRDA